MHIHPTKNYAYLRIPKKISESMVGTMIEYTVESLLWLQYVYIYSLDLQRLWVSNPKYFRPG